MKTQPTLADLLSPFPYWVSLSGSLQGYFSFVTEKNKISLSTKIIPESGYLSFNEVSFSIIYFLFSFLPGKVKNAS